MAAEDPSEVPSEAADGDEAGMQHPRIVAVATAATTGEAASPAASRTAAVRTGAVAGGQAALREATSEASTGPAGRLIESRPQHWMLSFINA